MKILRFLCWFVIVIAFIGTAGSLMAIMFDDANKAQSIGVGVFWLAVLLAFISLEQRATKKINTNKDVSKNVDNYINN